MDSDTSIYSEFHRKTIDLPQGWTGYLKGDLPAFKITNKDETCSVTITTAYDASEIFSWARQHFDPDTYEIVEKDSSRILIEKHPESNQYMLAISSESATDGTWVWRMRISYLPKNESNVKCGLSYLLDQLTEEN